MAYNPAYATEITLQPLRRFDLDAAILFSDILVVPHALGLGLEFLEGEGPKLQTVSSFEDILNLREADVLPRLTPVMEAVANVRAKMPKDKALIGFAGAPWTVASYMIEGGGGHDFSKTVSMAKNNQDVFLRLIDVLVRSSVVYLDAQIKAGAQAVQLFESWAGVLSGDDFRRWVIEPNARIAKAIKSAHPEVPFIGFPRTDNADDLYAFTAGIGADCIGISQDIAPDWAAQNIQQRLCVQGNLDPGLLLKGGSDMTLAAENICNALDEGPFVFNLGHGVIKETNPDHVADLIRVVHTHKRKAAAA